MSELRLTYHGKEVIVLVKNYIIIYNYISLIFFNAALYCFRRKLPDQKLDSACGQACDMFSPPARVETAKSPMVPGREGCPLNVPADQVGGCGRARLPLGLSTEL